MLPFMKTSTPKLQVSYIVKLYRKSAVIPNEIFLSSLI